MRRLGIVPHLFDKSQPVDAHEKKKGCLSTISRCNRLLRPGINFPLPPDLAGITPMHFFSLLRGQGEGCVMFIGPFGLTTVYDVALKSVIAMPQANFPKPSDSIALPMTRRDGHYQLYVVAREESGGSFEVFNYCRAGAPTDGGGPGILCRPHPRLNLTGVLLQRPWLTRRQYACRPMMAAPTPSTR
jgi:hypothetical protein